ncbi:hypothetical protein HYV43_00720 [Candidatus Micrarchaeota archaeon]|nr:hypothetical protein [Candidatus Micrarchaeota archaeon]
MVHAEHLRGAAVFVCDACRLAYRDEKTASACEAYCRAHNACSLDLIRHAVPRD